ncbi:outer membrane protein with beta-barrel domain [Roseivirga pacifica]|uniref:Outer membrane protein beta-barrel domain-containing protein n=2 Tax=Roseivirga pacifica TaxID=1267423 RepID=A0A1I0RLK9_9BACT|nr:outer membrane protein with beta-barrel domain [Roseivirga pacifica]SEW41269.1 Outer membrane protein beta-barrel domain-containing protein [Roseivirga pacifica]
MYTFKKYYLCHRFKQRNYMKKSLLIFALIFVAFSAKAQRPDLPGALVFDFGFNSWSDKPTGADLNWFQSKTVNATYFYDLPIGKGGFTLTPGLGMSWEKYTFDNNTTLVSSISNGQRTTEVVDLEDQFGSLSFDKSKLGLFYVDMPLEIRWYANRDKYSRGFRVAAGGKVGVLYSSFTKVKFQDALGDNRMLKDRKELGFNRFRYGLQARVGWGGFAIFSFYELSDKFDNPPAGGADTRTLTIGISLTGF